METLRVTSPMMTGPPVERAQRNINEQRIVERTHVTVDGEFGPLTGAACKRIKWLLGYELAGVAPTYGDALDAFLAGGAKQSDEMLRRARERAKPLNAAAAKRHEAVRIALPWVGWTESPAGTNHVPRLTEIARRHHVREYYARMGYFWCDFGVHLAALIAGSIHARMTLVEGKSNPLFCPTTLADARAHKYGTWTIPWDEAGPGDWLLFKGSRPGQPKHIEEIHGSVSATGCKAIGFNTSSADTDGDGDQDVNPNGGGIFLNRRSRGLVEAVVRWV